MAKAVQVRVSDDEDEAFEAAARLLGVSKSAFARMSLRLAAIEALSKAGLPVPFLED